MGHEGAVRELLESGVDVDEVTTDDGIKLRFSWLHEEATRAWSGSS